MTKSTKWSLSTRITLLCLPVVVILTVLASAAAYTASQNRTQLDTLLNSVGPVRTNSQALEIAMLNQETGIRGYAINGTDADLQPYIDGLADQKSILASLTQATKDQPKIDQDLAATTAAIDGWHQNVAEPVRAAVKAGDHQTALTLIDPKSRGRFDAVRDHIHTLQADVLNLRNTTVSDLQKTTNQIAWALVGSVAVVILAGLLLAWLLQRMVTRPVKDLAAEVRLVVAGDYNHTIDTSGPPEVAGLGRDIDEMRQRIVSDLRIVQDASDAVADANTQLERQAADLSRSNQDLEQFAYVASHDLQEPLRKIASFCQLLQRRYAGKLDERADQYISFAVDGAHRMQRLINDLLAFSRIGRLTAGFTAVDLQEVVTTAVAANDDGLSRTDGTVTFDGLPTIEGEEPLLLALFSNLVSNSVKFRTPDVPVRIAVTTERTGDEWEITFRDNGIGIEQDYAEKVFVIFQRLHSREAYPGTGIGLAICKRIVEYHGGRIWVDTSVPDGTAICFTLPVKQPVNQSDDSTVANYRLPEKVSADV